ncbi:hypothetical protein [Endozoicomonas sp. 8E]|uniref:hypothetical protein n=1 Tax=Endozoicomonas sp. 8E TaxID=3035692 RepID=UPI0029394599|nr:hypothetical protein [Endozoicomonas sp. 8E]WOG29477.1 hypothetical protein P6910_07455 [Endozoicomonas sp. 8E]
MPRNRLAFGQLFFILLTLLLLMLSTYSFSLESCQTESCSRGDYRFPLAVLFASVAAYFAWPETPHSPVTGDDESCSIQPFELWKPKLDSEFCQSLIATKNCTEALKLLRKTQAMEPVTMSCDDWQADLEDYFNWRWPGNSASQWQQIPVRYKGLQWVTDTMDEAEFIAFLARSPSVFSLNRIRINDQQFILKGYADTGFMITPMLKVAECYFVPEEEPVAFGFDEWSGLIGGRMHSLFKAVKGRSLRDWVAESRRPSSRFDIDALFSELGQILAKFHLRHRVSTFDGIYTLSRAVHRDPNFNNVFYDEKSGFSLIDTIGLSVSVLEPSGVFYDLNQLFLEMNGSQISKDGFTRAYISQWPEDVQESLKKQIESLQVVQINYTPSYRKP